MHVRSHKVLASTDRLTQKNYHTSTVNTQYSYQQIVDEIEQSIAKAEEFEIKSPSNFTSKNTNYILFGHLIPNIFMPLARFNDFMKKNKNIKYLKSQ